MKRFLLLSLLVVLSFSSTYAKFILKDSVKSYLDYAEQQYKHNVTDFTDNYTFMRGYIPSNNSFRIVGAADWTSGFYPGIMWLLYDHTGDDFWRNKALIYTKAVNGEQTKSGDHDIGFKILGSYGNAYTYTQSDSAASVIQTASKRFATMYNPVVGCTRSWYHTPSRFPTELKPANFPVIIDNMMNLELFAKSTLLSGDAQFIDMATQHALSTMTNHIREDSSTYHVVEYFPTDGLIRWKGTQQGYDHESTWSRGQAWGIYGFTMMYRYTNHPQMLATAKALAAYFIAHTPSDHIVYYDFSLPVELTGNQKSRDVSASSIAASAFVELFSITGDSIYLKQSEQILTALSSAPYRAALHSNGNFILKEFTGGRDYQVNESSNFADYYYIEALLRYARLSGAHTPAHHRPELRNNTEYQGSTFKVLTDSLRFFDIDGQEISYTLDAGLYPDAVEYRFVNGSRFEFRFSKPGIYYFPLHLADDNNQVTETLKITVIESTGIQTNESENSWKVFVDNAAQQIVVSENASAPFEVVDLSGRVLIQTQNRLIPISHLRKGIYLIKSAVGNSRKIVL